MVGVIPGEAHMTERPVGRGYALLRGRGHTPLAAAGIQFAAHEFHHSALFGLPSQPEAAYTVVRGHGLDGQVDGFVFKNVLASYCHRRGSGPNGWIKPFLQLLESRKASVLH